MSHFLLLTWSGAAGPETADAFVRPLRQVLAMPGQDLDGPTVHHAHPGGGTLLAAWSANPLPAGADDLVAHIHRCSGAHVDVAAGTVRTGVVTPRSWWYARSGDVAVASTSLRAVSFVLGDFEPQPEAAAWMLSAGSLGPEVGWDRRVRQVPGSATLDVRTATVHLGDPLPPPASRPPEGDLASRFDRLLGDVLSRIDYDRESWILPLSGGVDSRGLAFHLGDRLDTITHGTPQSANDELSDAGVAAAISREFGWSNRFIPFPPGSADAESLLDRFCRASECRIDHVGGYADGMASYEDLVDRGIRGLIRGDEVFGWNRRMTAFATRDSVGALLMGDVGLPRDTAGALAPLGRAQRPISSMVQRSEQRLPVFRDELYRTFRVPAILAPLTETKSCYLDVTTPLLDDEIVRFAAALPDELRTDKRFWAEFVAGRSRGVPFAVHRSAPGQEDVITRPDVVALVTAGLAGGAATAVGVPDSVLDRLASGAGAGAAGRAPERRARRVVAEVRDRAVELVPHRWKREIAIRRAPHPRVTAGVLAFRAYLAGRAVELMTEAAEQGRAASERTGWRPSAPA